MENHRLKPMQPGYDRELFNDLYVNTKGLRKKLASEIDPRRFGVDHQIILSWFDDKFIHAFNRYYPDKTSPLLKAHIIRSLQFFKKRVLRYAYTKKNLVNNCTVDVEELKGYNEPMTSPSYDDTSYLSNLADKYFREVLSPDAYQVMQVELRPPLYILSRIKDSTTKIPGSLIGEYLGLETTKVNKLRAEIRDAIEGARDYFSDKAI